MLFRSAWFLQRLRLAKLQIECPVQSFANKLLFVQRQAEALLRRQGGDADPASVQQSFLLRGGHFTGVRWGQGDWQVEWSFQDHEMILRSAGQECQRVALQFPVIEESTAVSQRRAA